MANINKKTSRYKTTPKKDFYLDLWNYTPIPSTPDDTLYEIEPKYEKRPDLLAYELYGTPRLWWVFAIRNKNYLIDPIEDFKAGLVIYLPSKESLPVA